MKFRFVSLIFLLSLESWAASRYEEALCGQRPSGSSQESARKQKALKLENNMPPVANQSGARWCYAFVATDQLNFHRYKAAKARNRNISPYSFYKPENMVSPIDAVWAGKYHYNINANYKVEDEYLLDTRKGGLPYRVFFGFQELDYKARSENQIEFNALDENNQLGRNIIKGLIEEYDDSNDSGYVTTIAGLTCPYDLVTSSKFDEEVNSFKTINNWLLRTAQYNDVAPSNYEINYYDEIAKIKGEKDISLPEYTVNYHAVNDTSSHIEELKRAVYPDFPKMDELGSPIEVGVCSESVNPIEGQNSNDCSPHAVQITGFYWENGTCKIRIRNSYGKDWKDNGYDTISLADYLSYKDKYTKISQLKYESTWISTPKGSPPPKHRLVKEEIEFVGQRSFKYKNDNTFDYWPTDGKFNITRNTKTGKIEANDLPLGSGQLFDGVVTESSRGRYYPSKGYTYDSNGKIIYAYKHDLGNGKSYTGKVKDLGGGKIQLLGL